MAETTEKKPNILQARVDNRLIHGQMATIWTPSLDANLVLVANDRVAVDEAQKALLQMSAGTNVQTRFFTIQETLDKIHKASPKQRILLVIETLQDALRLVKGGLPVDTIVLGNMHPNPTTKPITPVIHVSEQDIADAKEIIDLGVKVVIRRVPTDSAKNLFDYKI